MRILPFVALLAAVSSSATAQIAPGRSGSSSQHFYSGQMVWDELTEFGACYATYERKRALELVSTPAGSLDEAKTYKRLFSGSNQGCLGDITSMRVPWQFVRGAIAEGFYQKRIPVPANLAITVPMTPEKVRSLSDVAACYVGRHPNNARALIETTRLGTKKETDAVLAMVNQLSECFPANPSRKPQFDTMLVRFRVAEALWRLGMVRTVTNSSAAVAK